MVSILVLLLLLCLLGGVGTWNTFGNGGLGFGVDPIVFILILLLLLGGFGYGTHYYGSW